MTMEERLARLESVVKKQQHELERAQAVNEVQTLCGQYAIYYAAGHYSECARLWSRREDSRAELGWGVYKGYSGICKAYNDHGPELTGLLRIHTFTSPAVIVAEDGLTARGTWISPGVDSQARDGKASCAWNWIKYGVDFIKDEGVWYIWHLNVYGLFTSDYYTSWGDGKPQPLDRDLSWLERMPESFRPEARVTHHDWTYAPDRRPELDPAPPVPYKTWDEIGYGY